MYIHIHIANPYSQFEHIYILQMCVAYRNLAITQKLLYIFHILL